MDYVIALDVIQGQSAKVIIIKQTLFTQCRTEKKKFSTLMKIMAKLIAIQYNL